VQIFSIDHIHVFQTDLEEVACFFSDIFDCRWVGPLERPHSGIRTAFAQNGLEIIQPTVPDDKLGISAYIEKHGIGIGTLGLKVPDIEKAISEFESNGAVLLARGSYATGANTDVKAAVFTSESAHGVPFELVEYANMAPMAVAGLNWVHRMPWMQPSIKPGSAINIKAEGINNITFFQDDLDNSVKFFASLLGIRWVGPVEVKDLGIKIAFSDAGINIIQPIGEDNLGILEYMKKNGEGIGSIGFKVPDIEKAILELKSRKVRLVGKGTFTGKQNADLKMAFFDPETSYGIMIELVEFQNYTPVVLANLNWVQRLPWIE
jgi:methylmalonyl-CoA/ethylmalonyl-CoA epimerase